MDKPIRKSSNDNSDYTKPPPTYEESKGHSSVSFGEDKPSCTKRAVNLAGRAVVNIGHGTLNFGRFIVNYFNQSTPEPEPEPDPILSPMDFVNHLFSFMNTCNRRKKARKPKPSCTKVAVNLAGRAVVNLGLGAYSALSFSRSVANYLNNSECIKKYTYCSRNPDSDLSPTTYINNVYSSLMNTNTHTYNCNGVDYDCIFRVKILPVLCSALFIEAAFTGMDQLAPQLMPHRTKAERLAVAVGALSTGIIGSSKLFENGSLPYGLIAVAFAILSLNVLNRIKHH